MIRTIVSATSALARAGLSAALRAESRVTVVAEVSPEELLRSVAALEPDVVVALPPHGRERSENGELLRAPTVLLVDDPRGVWNGELASNERLPFAVLARDASPDEIVAAVVAVAAGLVAASPGVLADGAPQATFEQLTAREIEVLAELARGASNKAVAERLHISEHTVKFHIGSIFAKLGVSSRTEAVTHGFRLGLIML
ncbi:MAG: response regulator transcription factor [Vulcanimicrobiaceae bacterium]